MDLAVEIVAGLVALGVVAFVAAQLGVLAVGILPRRVRERVSDRLGL